jgi:hypothetical protein
MRSGVTDELSDRSKRPPLGIGGTDLGDGRLGISGPEYEQPATPATTGLPGRRARRLSVVVFVGPLSVIAWK